MACGGTASIRALGGVPALPVAMLPGVVEPVHRQADRRPSTGSDRVGELSGQRRLSGSGHAVDGHPQRMTRSLNCQPISHPADDVRSICSAHAGVGGVFVGTWPPALIERDICRMVARWRPAPA
jgi:hypothetical protein